MLAITAAEFDASSISADFAAVADRRLVRRPLAHPEPATLVSKGALNAY
ncbi:hypothetical protein [Bradyrhizobium tropiciagri]|nr:hypothetical protein [Bradyrhizobium tropiciagri]